MKKYLIALGLGAIIFAMPTQAYLLWFKSRDNTIWNIQQIESTYPLHLPIVSFIFDPRGPWVIDTVNKLPSTLGNDRIYHISLSPNNLSAKEVADGKFDAQYKKFFASVKSGDLKVVFRTMHEMNGGWYPWSSNPTTFKQARVHVWNLSRQAGLTSQNILFDMSLNARDLPAKNGKPAQTATFIQCQLSAKARLHCPTFEDYYPWDQYVDLLGVTFYNWGKGNSNRRRWTPREIINAKGRQTLDRMKTFHKPIYVDEVGTTAVNYEGPYSYAKSLEVYKTSKDAKNQRLFQLRDFLSEEPSIVGANYFNVDLTNGLQNRTIGELDRSVIDFQSHKYYDGIMAVYKSSEKIQDNNSRLLNIFNIQYLDLSGVHLLVPSQYRKPLIDLYAQITTGGIDTESALQSLASGWLQRLYKRFSATDATAITNILSKAIHEGQEKSAH